MIHSPNACDGVIEAHGDAGAEEGLDDGGFEACVIFTGVDNDFFFHLDIQSMQL